MTTQRLRSGAAVVLGIGAGLGVALAWSALSAPPSTDPRLAALEQQLAELEAERGGPSPPVMPGEPPSPEEEAAIEAQHLALWSAKLVEHAAQDVDARWSAMASQGLAADLARLGDERGFLLVSTDCRTTTCAAALRWPSYEAAVDGFSALLHAEYALACERRITLPEPEDPAAPYEGTILFDCAPARTPA